MDIGEKLFQWVHSGGKARREKVFEGRPVLEVSGSGALQRLELVASALECRPIRVRLSDAFEPGSPSSRVLPRRISLSGDAEGDYTVLLYRLLLSHGAAAKGLLSDRGVSPGSVVSMDVILSDLPKIRAHLLKTQPGFARISSEVESTVRAAIPSFLRFDPAFEPWAEFVLRTFEDDPLSPSDADRKRLSKAWSPLWPGSPFCPIQVLPSLLSAADPALDPGVEVGPAPANARTLPSGKDVRRELRVKTVSRPKAVELKKHADAPLTHVFEKVLTAEEYRGGSKNQDGTDETDAHADALSELTLDSVTRGDTPAESVLTSDAELRVSAPELDPGSALPSETVHFYPEWFRGSGAYRRDFCRLRERVADEEASDAFEVHSPAARELSQRISVFLNESRWRTRQKDGSDLDLDAVVRWRSQWKGDGPVDPRLFVGRRRLERDLAVLILMDGSLSTDGWSGDRRILEVMKAAIGIVGGAFEGLDDRFGVAVFNSHTRTDCRYSWIKGFDEEWLTGRRRLRGVRPEGYTRIGPAIRHSGAVLDRIRARRKLVLLFSDAKPTDYDRYEGEHGVSDVAKAVEELHAHRIQLRGIAVAREPGIDLARMFGSGGYHVISEPQEIASRVVEIFTRLSR